MPQCLRRPDQFLVVKVIDSLPKEILVEQAIDGAEMEEDRSCEILRVIPGRQERTKPRAEFRNGMDAIP
jgi:hypothetical protein